MEPVKKFQDARLIGNLRDRQIEKLIGELGFLCREQIQALLFKDAQKASARLKKLFDRKRLKRKRLDIEESYIYYSPGKNWTNKSKHTMLTNWLYVALETQKKQWQKIHVFQHEYICRDAAGEVILRADALVVIENTATKTLTPILVELDRAESNNGWDKTAKYTEYFRAGQWAQEWWSKQNSEGVHRFPRVLVVTDRRDRLEKKIAGENPEGIRFVVATLDEVRRDVFGVVGRNVITNP